jgi:hypothetical protein
MIFESPIDQDAKLVNPFNVLTFPDRMPYL